jgi:hypothetical protein
MVHQPLIPIKHHLTDARNTRSPTGTQGWPQQETLGVPDARSTRLF